MKPTRAEVEKLAKELHSLWTSYPDKRLGWRRSLKKDAWRAVARHVYKLKGTK